MNEPSELGAAVLEDGGRVICDGVFGRRSRRNGCGFGDRSDLQSSKPQPSGTRRPGIGAGLGAGAAALIPRLVSAKQFGIVPLSVHEFALAALILVSVAVTTCLSPTVAALRWIRGASTK